MSTALSLSLGPYREAISSEVLEASTQRGLARLDIGPTHALLELVDRARISITRSMLNLTTGQLERRPRSLSVKLDDVRLLVARAYPTGEVALWLDAAGHPLDRTLSLVPLRPLDPVALDASRALDRLGERLGSALVAQGCATHRAVEFGKGQHRVLLVIHDDRMVVYARPLFRERLFRRLELLADGTALVPVRNGKELRIGCRTRFDVLIRGDFLCLESAHDGAHAEIWLPWISRADREELASFLGLMFDPASP